MDLGRTKYICNDQTRFLDLIVYKDSYYIASGKLLVIKSKANIDLAIENVILKLLDTLYVWSLIINLISIAKFWSNKINIYFSTDHLIELLFNKIIFAYVDNIKD